MLHSLGQISSIFYIYKYFPLSHADHPQAILFIIPHYEIFEITVFLKAISSIVQPVDIFLRQLTK